ncbi:gliding motility-associated lipoprotein GldB [Chitinophaga skermanii]|uniref:Gliding motility-associated lipoprotein GldB n=1 Tax=Chitinophaga skermanii TaxID=331697 RepID=A0A327QIG7_9BACT|nr:gliding motility lipoprotein GldB [Chitinophaga skermanii]RAJ04111.1 gliding motility-associated lipoprotein GldB [Chitinophaga skermanii]
MQNYINKYFFRLLLGTGLALSLFSSCGTKSKAPDISQIAINVKVERFDQALMRVDTNNVASGLKLLNETYPVFFPVFVEHIMNMGPYSDSSALVMKQMHNMLTNKDIRGLAEEVDLKFPNTQQIAKELSEAFRYTKYYIPSFNAPKVVGFISAISNFGAVTVDSVLGIGLDMYLGEDFPIYGLLAEEFPAYMVRKFTPQYIVPNAMRAWAQQHYPFRADGAKLIEQFVDMGKQQYFLDKVMPNTPDTLKIGYTAAQLKWCEQNEEMIYKYFVMNELLYTTDFQKIMHYTNETPSTQGMPGEAPGQIGYYVGWQIVKQYMEKHPDVTLQQLMEHKDALQIFTESKYRPR